MPDLIIRGDADNLEELRRAIEAEIGPDARPFPYASAEDGQLREPILIALIVALGGPALTKAIAGVVTRYLEHKEIMLKLALQDGSGNEKPVTLADLGATHP